MVKNKRNGSVDFWKFLFAVVIVFFHGKNLTDGESYAFLGGSIGVEFFFIVSGVLMANSAQRMSEGQENITLGQDTFRFIKKKILGLMPEIYFAWIIAFLVKHIGEFSIKGMMKDAIESIGELLFLTESGFMGYRANTVCWYISAMLLAMLILYPLMRKYKDSFFYIIAPILAIFLFGITYQNWNSLRAPHVWLGYCYKSIVRATMCITIGCICFKISQNMRKITYTSFAKVLWTIVEWGGYGAVLLWSYKHGGGKEDWLLVICMSIAIICSFAQTSITDAFFSRYRIFNWLGEFSFSLFLGHG